MRSKHYAMNALSIVLGLRFLGSVNRTNACAGAAINAKVGVYNINAVALSDSANGAFSLTCTASNACIGNNICHIKHLQMLLEL